MYSARGSSSCSCEPSTNNLLFSVYTENNKLFVEGSQEQDEEPLAEYIHRGLATRDFTRVWTISDDVRVEDVVYDNGILTIILKRIIPDHQKRHDWL